MHPFLGGPAGVGSVLLACVDYKKLDFFYKTYLSWTWASNVVETKTTEFCSVSFFTPFMGECNSIGSGISFLHLWVTV